MLTVLDHSELYSSNLQLARRGEREESSAESE